MEKFSLPMRYEAVLTSRTDMLCQRDHIGLEQSYRVSCGCTFQKRQRVRLCWWGLSARDKFSGHHFIKGGTGLVAPKETKSLHSLASNLRAWTKNAENFYGDEDDTLFEPTHDKPILFMKEEKNSFFGKFGWLPWLFGPLVLLVTGVIPTLWLPAVPLFQGSATAGLLALAGLDGIFNLGASMFLLLTDACARKQRKGADRLYHEIPPGYKFWTLFVNLVGLFGPVMAYLGSKSGCFGTEPVLLPIAAMLVPYVSLLLVHTLTEFLVWKWQSPVWLILPLVYGCYSVLQLSRGLQLGQALGAPLWTIEAVKGLISWWVLVLSVQLMWISWFVGGSQG